MGYYVLLLVLGVFVGKCTRGSGGVLMLGQGPSSGAGGAATATGTAAGASASPEVVAGAAKLLPWEMQLVMEYCDQVSLQGFLQIVPFVSRDCAVVIGVLWVCVCVAAVTC
jgi:hypothetical protein